MVRGSQPSHAASPRRAPAVGRLAHPPPSNTNTSLSSLWMRHRYSNGIGKNTEDKMVMYKTLHHSGCSEWLENNSFHLSIFFAKPNHTGTATLKWITNKKSTLKSKLIPSTGKLLIVNCQLVSNKRRWQNTLLCLPHYATEVNFNKSLGCPFILF